MSSNSPGGRVLEESDLKVLDQPIKGPKADTWEIFVPSIPGPGNIRRTDGGNFWVASNSVKLVVVATEPSAVKISFVGEFIRRISLGEYYGDTLVTEVNEYKSVIYMGTLTTNFVGNLICNKENIIKFLFLLLKPQNKLQIFIEKHKISYRGASSNDSTIC